MSERILEEIGRLPAVSQINELLAERQQPIAVTGLSAMGRTLLCSLLATRRPLLIVCPGEEEVRRLQADLEGLGQAPLAVPYTDVVLHGVEGASREFMHQQLGVLGRLLGGAAGPVLTTPDALSQLLVPPAVLQGYTCTLSAGEDIALEALLLLLVEAGYTRCDLVEGAGQFAVRGGIVDIFAPGAAHPVRVEFFGDTVDTLNRFDPLTQRRTEAVSQLLIPPATRLLPEGGREALLQRLDRVVGAQRRRRGEGAQRVLELLLEEAERLRETGAAGDRLIPILWESTATLLDYLPDAQVAVFDERACAKRLEEAQALQHEDLKNAVEEGQLTGELTRFSLTPGELWSALGKRELLYLEMLPHGRYELPPKGLVSVRERHMPGFGESPAMLREELEELLEGGYRVLLFAATEQRAEQLKKVLAEGGLLRGGLQLCTGALSSGVVYPDARLAVLTDAGAGAARRGRRRRAAPGEKIRTYSDLREGDYVVHQNYGIGRYQGIVQLEIEGVLKDYIKIQYQGEDVLYVPANQLDLVSKYISGDERSRVRLSKMGGVEWQKTKQRVRGAAKDMARQLTVLYAQRQQLRGYAFDPDSDWQAAFEAGFPFVETDDQLRCIEETKRDMEKPVPMDRLLCGDVGFGKTEVAMRAAFKAIDNGRQVAFLVPTTILSWQHYTNIQSRFAAFPMRIENLSRFRTPRQQADILRRLRRGELDMVIGTHRLIQKDVQFKDLGLLIVDEEQRFGVGHKERLKEQFKTVDVLTLTATPIPRTLGMALSGIRDMSVIEEPPQDRQPVQTYVLEQDDQILLEAVRKELRRGGQVFYLHNRVDSIDRRAAELQQRLPEARIMVAHGQMGEEPLSDIWAQMVAGEVDVLVCTTIIETGIDIPAANTLIVEGADRLGLAQLYQIRGRVGRSSRRAYAYFTYKRDKVLTEDAIKRLSTLREFTAFGSGFKIALRDLEIRGAGSVLGAEQHGHMEAVGYDLYLRLLEEAVEEERTGLPVRRVSCSVDFVIDAYIPKDYIESAELRIDVYKKVAAVENDEDLSDLYDELCDRFGDLPLPLQNLCRTSLLRSRAGALGILDIVEKSGNLVIDASAIPMETVSALAAGHRGRILFSAGQKPYLTCRPKKGENGLDTAEWAVARIAEALAAAEAAQQAEGGQ
ncbi:MAG: transcription-repair coupling factor [Clostridiales bacterium]|nr:transcription-repair coupling factor [Clostridiales bacterium]